MIIDEQFPSDSVFCGFFFFGGFIGDMGHSNAQIHKCTNSCSRLIKSSASLLKLHIYCAMVVAQLFEVTVAADGSELSSKRVSKLSRKYHLHKKQLRQSARMADGLPDAAAADGGNDDGDRSGGHFDTSADAEFSLSTQPPSIGHRSTISVAMNHPAAAARRAKKPLPPRRESPGRNCKRTNANAVGGRLPPRPRLPLCPPSHPPQSSHQIYYYSSRPPEESVC